MVSRFPLLTTSRGDLQVSIRCYMKAEYNEPLDESAKSEELDPSDFFRFTLLVLPGKPAFWLELPKFKDGTKATCLAMFLLMLLKMRF